MASHGLACAVIALSRQLLLSGLQDIIHSSLTKSFCNGRTLSSLSLERLIFKIILSQKDAILPSLLRFIKEYCEDYEEGNLACYLRKHLCGYLLEPSNLPSDRLIERDSTIPLSSTNFNCTNITHGQFGRMLATSNGIGRGHIALRESPACAVVKSSCTCHEHVILNEYITLAWGIAMLIGIDEMSSKPDKSQQEYQHWQAFQSSPLSRHQRQVFRHIMDNFQSGLGVNVLRAREGDEVHSTEWSLEVQTFISVAASLCYLYTWHEYSSKSAQTAKDSIDSIPLSSSLMFNIIARIPANTHAVFHMHRSMNGREEIIEQRKLGFALFCNASAVNHSCDPNSIVRYNTKENGEKDDKQPLCIESLASTTIEVVLLKSVGINSEICISYGPIHGKHSYNVRQEILRNQYLFQCLCHSCQSELSLQTIPAKGSDKVNDRMDTINKDARIREVTDMCEQLQQYHLKIEKINIQVTDLLSGPVGNATIDQFHGSRMAPLRDELEVFKLRYFELPVGINASRKISSDKEGHHRSRDLAIDREVYHEFSGLYTIYLDLEARVLSSLGRYSLAAENVVLATSLLVASGKYGEGDIAIQREYIKLGQLHFSAGEMRKAEIIIQKAISSMRNIVHPEDPDYQEGLNILRYLQRK